MDGSWQGRRVLVLGLGNFGGGAAVVRFLCEQGSRVAVTDLRGEAQLAPVLDSLQDLEFATFLGANPPAALAGAEAVVVNPAVPPTAPLLVEARRRELHLTSETELLLRHCPAPVTAITGTNGKSTTTALLGHLLRAAGQPVLVGGNLGLSLLPRLGEITPAHQVVLELSSFQADLLPPAPFLERLVVTNVTRDHLDRYGEEADYHRAKERMLGLVRPGGAVVVNRDDPVSRRWSLPPGVRAVAFGASPAAAGEVGLDGGELRSRLPEGEGPILPLGEFPLPGAFQAENALAAAAAAILAGVAPAAAGRAIATFTGVDHRLQPLGRLGEVAIVDNGVSTTPETTISALEALPGRVHLVAGGKSKGADPAPFAAALGRLAASAHLFGRAAPGLGREVDRHPPAGGWSLSEPLEEALEKGLAACGPGETLLFSPGHSSFDAYLNFQHRARAFRRWLEEKRKGRAPAV